jgi:membrane-associated protein
MEYRRFLSFNIIGGFCWAVGVTTAGYVLGSTVPSIDRYLLPIIAGIIILSLAPTIIEIMKDDRRRRQVFETIHALIRRVYEGKRR